jgi:hypothetical protein
VWHIEWDKVQIDWGKILTGIIAAGAAWIARSVWEMRRRIRFSVPELYFGPALNHNPFLGRDYPSEDMFGLDCEIRFFNEKPDVIGLHEFHFEFCRKTTLRTQVDFRPDMDHVIRDWDKKDSVFRLEVLELPSKKFVCLSLRFHIDREDWPKVSECNFVRLACKTSDGKRKHFPIGDIKIPEMPPPGLRGREYMSVNILPLEYPPQPNQPISGFVIQAARRRKPVMMNFLELAPEDARYWTGDDWARSKGKGRVFREHTEARDEGERLKIWDRVPDEWLAKLQ